MEISRRGFMAMAAALLAAETVEQVIPGVARVYSFPSRVVAPIGRSVEVVCYDDLVSREYIVPRLADEVFKTTPFFAGKILSRRE